MGDQKLWAMSEDREYWDSKAETPPYDKAPDAMTNGPTVAEPLTGPGNHAHDVRKGGGKTGREGGRHG